MESCYNFTIIYMIIYIHIYVYITIYFLFKKYVYIKEIFYFLRLKKGLSFFH